MAGNDNVEKLRNAYKIWNDTKGGSVEHWMDLMDDNIKFMSLAQGAAGAEFTRDVTAKSELEGYFNGLSTEWSMVHFTVDEFVAEKDRVVMIGSTAWTNKNTGKTAESPKVDIFRMKNGKIIEFAEFYDTACLIACSVS